MKKIPVIQSTLSALHLGHFLESKYHLSSATYCKLLKTGVNHSYVATDGESKYVFRVYTYNWRTKLEVSEEIRLLVSLKNHNIPVSYPIVDQSGEFIQEIDAPEGVRYGVLFSFAEGEKISNFDTQASYQVGVVMAEIHKLTENFELNRITYNSKTLLIESLKQINQYFPDVPDKMEYLERLSNYLIRKYDEVANQRKDVRFGAVHFDIWFDNMHFKNEREVTVYDFDYCGNGFLCHDISYFLFQLYNTNQDIDEYTLKADSFLNGYESIAEITAKERELIPFACLGIGIYFISMQCIKYDTWSNAFLNTDHLNNIIRSFEKWLAFNKEAI